MKYRKEAKGRAIQNLNISRDDKVKAFICTQDLKDQDYIKNHNLIMVTKKGQVKKTSLEILQNGVRQLLSKKEMSC
jgi:DNA gyrase subunit A